MQRWTLPQFRDLGTVIAYFLFPLKLTCSVSTTCSKHGIELRMFALDKKKGFQSNPRVFLWGFVLVYNHNVSNRTLICCVWSTFNLTNAACNWLPLNTILPGTLLSLYIIVEPAMRAMLVLLYLSRLERLSMPVLGHRGGFNLEVQTMFTLNSKFASCFLKVASSSLEDLEVNERGHS